MVLLNEVILTKIMIELVIQVVHKVSSQLKKIISNDEIMQWGLFYVNQNFIKFVFTLEFVSDEIFMCFR